MALKCKVLSVVISMESPFPFNSRESITFCLISAVMAPKKRCRSQHVKGSAFERSSRCSFQVVKGRVALPLSLTAMLALTLPPKVVENVIKFGCGAAPRGAMWVGAEGAKRALLQEVWKGKMGRRFEILGTGESRAHTPTSVLLG